MSDTLAIDEGRMKGKKEIRPQGTSPRKKKPRKNSLTEWSGGVPQGKALERVSPNRVGVRG